MMGIYTNKRQSPHWLTHWLITNSPISPVDRSLKFGRLIPYSLRTKVKQVSFGNSTRNGHNGHMFHDAIYTIYDSFLYCSLCYNLYALELGFVCIVFWRHCFGVSLFIICLTFIVDWIAGIQNYVNIKK